MRTSYIFLHPFVSTGVTAWLSCLEGRVVLVVSLFFLLFFSTIPAQLFAGQSSSQLRVCLLAHNLPFSTQQEEKGFDFEVAQALSKTLGRTLVPVWVKQDERITEVDESDFPLSRLSKNECDAILSVPGQDAVRDSPQVTLGRAYYGAAFELIGREGQTPASLQEVEQQTVAVQAQTIAGFILESLKIPMQTFFSTEQALETLTQEEAELAFLWGPTAGWYVKNHPAAKLAFATAEPLSVARWNEHVATRKEDAALRADIDSALSKLRNSGDLQTIAVRYGIPFYAPFKKTYDVMEMFKLSREAAKTAKE